MKKTTRFTLLTIAFTFVFSLFSYMPVIPGVENTASAKSFNFFQQLREDFKRDQEREIRKFQRDVSRDYLSFLRKRIRDSYSSSRNGSRNNYNQVTNVTINVSGEQQVYSFANRLSERELEVLAKIVEYSSVIGINEIPLKTNYERSLIKKLCESGAIPYSFIGSIHDRGSQLVGVRVERLE